MKEGQHGSPSRSACGRLPLAKAPTILMDGSEVAFGNANVVARENRNRRVQRMLFFGSPVCPPKIDLVFVRAIGKAAGAGDRIEDGQTETIGIFAALLDLAENVVGPVQRDLDVHARIT